MGPGTLEFHAPLGQRFDAVDVSEQGFVSVRRGHSQQRRQQQCQARGASRFEQGHGDLRQGGSWTARRPRQIWKGSQSVAMIPASQ